jgi:hypothetical protein
VEGMLRGSRGRSASGEAGEVIRGAVGKEAEAGVLVLREKQWKGAVGEAEDKGC